ncbi:hypothetical protein [Spirosoma utsteinense]|uniref:Outer membrane protein beta-barrel domain-containing protein n=1 Tax=Spirosoma utsteinense TaxID=2585773 RepID=A0ABR6WB70_9BACT|nr:hypothetical protein [Spirosoma utsteinense]MBC3788520.1 hypothetical protein [Spirosoma utsteinense]MBC3793166.1 hypothetical protein [Spirosoma utsteinense]
MKNTLTALLLLVGITAFGQASVAYYPFNSVMSVSTNADRALWLDARIQMNTVFGSLSTTICPMVNVVRRENISYYTGLGVRFNALNGLDDRDVLEGYSLHVGIRAKVPFLPNLRAAFEVAPYARQDFKIGVMQSYLGLVYQFSKRPKPLE